MNCPQTDKEDDNPILRKKKEVEAAVQLLKKGKSAGVGDCCSIGDWFQTTAGVQQIFMLSTIFNMSLERIMTDSLGDHVGTVSIGGRTITNLRFGGDIDGLGEEELAILAERLDKASTANGMEICVDYR